MKSKTLLFTNLLVCIIIVIGFATTSIISYRSNFGIYKKDIEQVSTLASEGIYNQINDIFSKPVNVSLTMANDSLLKNFLSDEEENFANQQYLAEMQEYLNTYRKKYTYDSVFLVSTNTNRYYHFNGVDRVLEKGDAENVWYYDFLNNNDEYSLNVDNDQATTADAITVFVNCKIYADDGSILGVVGVGLEVSHLQQLLKEYEDNYNVSVHLVNNDGIIEISSEKTGYEKVNLFDEVSYDDNKSLILNNTLDWQSFWYDNHSDCGYVVTKYEPNLNWHLIVESDTNDINHQLSVQLVRSVLIIILIIILVLITITIVIQKYNAQVVRLTVSQELEYQRLLHETTEELYENIFEIDITRNKAGGESTRQYFEELGLSRDADYSAALELVASKQIKEEYANKYADIFSTAHVLEEYNNGINNLSYDFMLSTDGINYHWVRISARIFFWSSDNSVRMITYHKNIDAEKRHELKLIDGIQRDAMTGLYNKRATEEMTTQALLTDMDSENMHAFLVLDVDNFKAVNDTMGHNFGDHVIHEIADVIKTQFRESDISGRIGGDEFAVLMKKVDTTEHLRRKLKHVCSRLNEKNVGLESEHHISCSIGVALYKADGTTYTELYEKADLALYYAKSQGKNSFYLYEDIPK